MLTWTWIYRYQLKVLCSDISYYFFWNNLPLSALCRGCNECSSRQNWKQQKKTYDQGAMIQLQLHQSQYLQCKKENYKLKDCLKCKSVWWWIKPCCLVHGWNNKKTRLQPSKIALTQYSAITFTTGPQNTSGAKPSDLQLAIHSTQCRLLSPWSGSETFGKPDSSVIKHLPQLPSSHLSERQGRAKQN